MVKRGKQLAEWDPVHHARSSPSSAGTVKYQDLIEKA